METLPGVECLTYDKDNGRAERRRLRHATRGRRFDALCLMHAGLRPSLASLAVSAGRRVGFDAERSRDLHGLFVGSRIEPPEGRHVVDGYFGFLRALGLNARELDWTVPISDTARDGAARRLPEGAPWLLVSPCASHAWRNWRPERYARVIEHAVKALGMRVALIGGPSHEERRMGEAIIAATRAPVTDLIGDSPLEMLIPLLARGAALVTPDSAPAHMANAAGVPTIALHAATDSRRSGPYLSLEWSVDRFDEACRRFKGKPADELPWDTRIRDAEAMDLIRVDDVTERLEAVMSCHGEGDRGRAAP